MSDTMFSLATAIVEEVVMAVLDAAEGRNPFDPRCNPQMLVARIASLVGECADKAGSYECPISSRWSRPGGGVKARLGSARHFVCQHTGAGIPATGPFSTTPIVLRIAGFTENQFVPVI
jgi:hypothetical protein